MRPARIALVALLAALVLPVAAGQSGQRAQGGEPGSAATDSAATDGAASGVAEPGVEPAAPSGARPIELPSYGARFVRMLWTLGLLLLGLFIAAAVLRRWLKSPGGLAFGAGGRHIQVLERVRLDARKSLCLVRVGGRYLLLGVSDQRVEVLRGEELDTDALRAMDDGDASAAAVDVVARGNARSFGARLLQRARQRDRRGAP